MFKDILSGKVDLIDFTLATLRGEEIKRDVGIKHKVRGKKQAKNSVSSQTKKEAKKIKINLPLLDTIKSNYTLLNGGLISEVASVEKTYNQGIDLSVLASLDIDIENGNKQEKDNEVSEPIVREIDNDVLSTIKKAFTSFAILHKIEDSYTIQDSVAGSRVDYIKMSPNTPKGRNILAKKLSDYKRELYSYLPPKIQGSRVVRNVVLRKADEDKRQLDVSLEDNGVLISIQKKSPNIISIYNISVSEMRGLEFFAEVKGENLIFEMGDRMPHLMIGGMTGGGKSVAMASIIQQWESHNSVREFSFSMVLPDNDEKVIPLFENSNHLAHQLVTPDGNSLKEILEETLALCKVYHGYMNPPNQKGHIPKPAIRNVLVLDEIATLVSIKAGDPYAKIKKEIAHYLDEIGAKGRKHGVHLLLATQSPSKALLDRLRDHVTILALKVSNKGIAVSMGHNKATDLFGKGDGYITYNGTTYRIQVPMHSSNSVASAREIL